MDFSQSLSRYILSNTTEDVFWRGVEYEKEGRVRNFQEEKKRLAAMVAGSQHYQAEFRQGPKYVKGYCTCPYALNEDYCKHVVALAVYWDLQRKMDLPDEQEVQDSCVEIEYGFGKKVEAMYRDPLHADLEFLARASYEGSWVRAHANIALLSSIPSVPAPVSLKEVRAGLQKIARVQRRSTYDPYFCAGEVSALLALAYDAVLKRTENMGKEEYLSLLAECIVFYYNTYLSMIDGSDGVWQIPLARIQAMFGDMESHGASKEEQEKLRAYLNKEIKGWGDIFEDIQFQFA